MSKPKPVEDLLTEDDFAIIHEENAAGGPVCGLGSAGRGPKGETSACPPAASEAARDHAAAIREPLDAYPALLGQRYIDAALLSLATLVSDLKAAREELAKVISGRDSYFLDLQLERRGRREAWRRAEAQAALVTSMREALEIASDELPEGTARNIAIATLEANPR